MKILKILILVISFVSLSYSQSINQFDDNGKRHGVWKKNFEGTKVLRYKGQFNHGKEIGTFQFYKNIKGKAVLTASKVFDAHSNFAEVKFFSSNGKVISEGKMDGKKYVGKWKYYHNNSDKLMTVEHYDNQGQLHGKRLVFYKNGQLAESSFYQLGKLEGEAKWYSIKNVVLKHFFYENGELHGVSKYYNPKGVLIAEGRYKNGKKHGVWKYYENGVLINEKDFTPKSKYKKKRLPN
ncbi:toxin-antitoxin system YwqK family antitoxin [Seonamhaeicola sp. ML3]|uniref:toxin-antitoxin system YwqK family antitoxin n=1 Tax=Seonamhaeicola sp. ML3 TaxID=2937786 RepID=UPI00200EB4F0|nr:toxin-antitoxin system YwqK family antitoxin [Seonamhaeicola sp. ML3]